MFYEEDANRLFTLNQNMIKKSYLHEIYLYVILTCILILTRNIYTSIL